MPLLTPPGGSSSSSSPSSSSTHLRRLDSAGSDSKLPRRRRKAGAPPGLRTFLSKVLLLLLSLDWRNFCVKFMGMTARGLLILSTYTSASVVAAKA
jgi:hypothetical protein